jgi:hypothetical protein
MWDDLAAAVWLGSDANASGVAALGSVSDVEFLTAFERRWPTKIQATTLESLRLDIWAAMQPGVIFDAEVAGARYQHLRLSIRRTEERQATLKHAATVEPMAFLIGAGPFS